MKNTISNAFISQVIQGNASDYKEGSYGSYHKLTSKVGIKVIFTSKTHHSLSSLRNSSAYEEARKEAKLLKEASKRSKLVAQYIGLRCFKDGEKWLVGILMEHIEGKVLADVDVKDEDDVMDMLIGKMRAVKVYIHDQNPYNFIKSGRGWRIIDFSPDWVEVKRMA